MKLHVMLCVVTFVIILYSVIATCIVKTTGQIIDIICDFDTCAIIFKYLDRYTGVYISEYRFETTVPVYYNVIFQDIYSLNQTGSVTLILIASVLFVYSTMVVINELF
jgi:hypothetical protein